MLFIQADLSHLNVVAFVFHDEQVRTGLWRGWLHRDRASLSCEEYRVTQFDDRIDKLTLKFAGEPRRVALQGTIVQDKLCQVFRVPNYRTLGALLVPTAQRMLRIRAHDVLFD